MSSEKKPFFLENTAESDLNEQIEKAYQNLFASRSYRARIVETNSTDGSSPGTTTINIEFVAPRRFHTVQTGTGTFPYDGETIIIGQDNYSKMPDSKWKKSSLKGGNLMDGRELPSDFSPSSEMIEEYLSTKHNSSDDITVIGEETVNGSPAKIYQFTTSLDAGAQKKSTKNKIWIGVNDNLLYKSETDQEFTWGPHTTKTKIAITFSDFGADLKIEPPI